MINAPVKNLSLRRKYMGSDWNFVPDTNIPKTTRLKAPELDIIDEKFQNIIIEPLGQPNKVEKLNLIKSQSKYIMPSKESESKVNSARYRSPWYIPPKYWQRLAAIPEKNTEYIENRAKNLYYFLHKSEPSLNPLKDKQKINNKNELKYSQSQDKLASLPPVQNYKK